MKTRSHWFVITSLLLISFGIILSSCSKDQTTNIITPVTNDDTLKINNNAIVVDTNAILISDSLEVTQGIYKFQYSGTPQSFNTNSIITGTQGTGFLRKVTSSSISGNTAILNTSQATMEDLFVKGNFSFNLDPSQGGTLLNKNILLQDKQIIIDKNEKINKTGDKEFKSKNENRVKNKIEYSVPGVKADASGFNFTFTNVNLYQNGPLSISIPNATLSFNPNFNFDFRFDNSTLQKLSFKFDNAQLVTNFDVNVNATQSVSISQEEKSLVRFSRIFYIWVGYVPVMVVTETNIKAVYSANFSSSLNVTQGVTSTNTLSLGGNYENGIWNDVYNLSSDNSLHQTNINGHINLNQYVRIVPEITVKFYGVAGPYLRPYIYENFQASVGSPNLDWQTKLSAGTAADVGAEITIFGRTISSYNKHFDGPEKSWIVPSNISIVSGNNQTGNINQQLQNPLKILVTDNQNVGHPNVPVYFAVTGGGGSVTTSQILTDQNGCAETSLILGATNGNNSVSAIIKKPNGEVLSVTNFNATTQVSSTWSSLGSGMNHFVYALTIFNGRLIAGGFFTNAGGVSANYIAQWNGTAWTSLGSGVNGDVWALCVYNGELIVGGEFKNAGGIPANCIAKWNGTSWSSFSPLVGQGVYALTVYNGELIAGGLFSHAGEDTTNNIAKWNGSSWSRLESGATNTVTTLTIYNGGLIAGGYFSTIGGINANQIALWNGSSWASLGNGLNGYVFATCVYNGELIAGGDFIQVDGGNAIYYLAKWNGFSWASLGNGVLNGNVRSLDVYNGNLIAGGSFSSAGGNNANSIARWNNSNWSTLGSGISGTVLDLVIFNEELIVGGGFNTAGGINVEHIAKWNGK